MPHRHHFDSIDTPIEQGITLLEASAGTGKTYAIEMLALRFVVEQDLPIEKILIVTFTKAATKELKERVRARLVEAKQYLKGQREESETDSSIVEWAEQLIALGEIEEQLIVQRITRALLNIDQAAIFTIHGFCQRLLKEHALESGQMFDVELSDEVDSVRQQLVEDFWRTYVYQGKAWQIALLCGQYKTPEALLKSVGKFSAQLKVLPKSESLDTLFLEIEVEIAKACKAFKQEVANLSKAVEEGFFKNKYPEQFAAFYAELSQWLEAGGLIESNPFSFPSLTCWQHFAQTRIDKNLRAKKEVSFDGAAFDDLEVLLAKVALVLRRLLAEELQEQLELKLQKLNIMSQDSLISRVAEALSSERAETLITAVAAQYSVALIDEFQDTDALQWGVFSQLFSHEAQFLYLIGDPKQAIYKFRGADIHTYLAAKSAAKHNYTLARNWRSHPNLVKSINHLFTINSAPFVLDGLDFQAVDPALKPEDGALYDKGKPLAPMALWQLEENNNKPTGYWTSSKTAGEALIGAVCNEVVHLLSNDIQLIIKDVSRGLEPADIAILVRNNSQAELYQSQLKILGIPAVISSNASVLASAEARHLQALMQALVNPSDLALLKQALTLPWFALKGSALNEVLNDEFLLGQWLERFQDYHHLWQKKGFMAMMLHLLNHEKVREHIAVTQQAERQLTDLQHVLELVQQVSLDEHLGLLKTLGWLESAITSNQAGDVQQLRLESDAEAIKVITMHGSKGLEYPVVFCPYLWDRKTGKGSLKSEKERISCHKDGEMIVDLGSEGFDDHREIALEEELAEDVRLAYVALTRAKYRCYAPWINLRTAAKIPNNSAFAHLLSSDEKDFSGLDFSEQQDVLQDLAENHPACFDYQMITANEEGQDSYRSEEKMTEFTVLRKTRSLYTAWQMSSYSALALLSVHEAPELPIDKADEPQAVATVQPLILAKGAHTGNVIHELLEYCRFQVLAEKQDISVQRDAACQRYGLKVSEPEVIDELLFQAVTTPLDAQALGFSLANLEEAACLKEMPFYLSLETVNSEQINAILLGQPCYQRLSAKKMQGYLTGFIDLICEYDGQYYVMDYKSNALDDYSEPSLIAAMREHNYGLQYWLYSVVLHLYLQRRLEDYQFAEHFGGVRYLFVRGMQNDKPMSGVFADCPDEQLIQDLVEVFTLE